MSYSTHMSIGASQPRQNFTRILPHREIDQLKLKSLKSISLSQVDKLVENKSQRENFNQINPVSNRTDCQVDLDIKTPETQHQLTSLSDVESGLTMSSKYSYIKSINYVRMPQTTNGELNILFDQNYLLPPIDQVTEYSDDVNEGEKHYLQYKKNYDELFPHYCHQSSDHHIYCQCFQCLFVKQFAYYYFKYQYINFTEQVKIVENDSNPSLLASASQDYNHLPFYYQAGDLFEFMTETMQEQSEIVDSKFTLNNNIMDSANGALEEDYDHYVQNYYHQKDYEKHKRYKYKTRTHHTDCNCRRCNWILDYEEDIGKGDYYQNGYLCRYSEYTEDNQDFNLPIYKQELDGRCKQEKQFYSYTNITGKQMYAEQGNDKIKEQNYVLCQPLPKVVLVYDYLAWDFQIVYIQPLLTFIGQQIQRRLNLHGGFTIGRMLLPSTLMLQYHIQITLTLDYTHADNILIINSYMHHMLTHSGMRAYNGNIRDYILGLFELSDGNCIFIHYMLTKVGMKSYNGNISNKFIINHFVKRTNIDVFILAILIILNTIIFKPMILLYKVIIYLGKAIMKLLFIFIIVFYIHYLLTHTGMHSINGNQAGFLNDLNNLPNPDNVKLVGKEKDLIAYLNPLQVKYQNVHTMQSQWSEMKEFTSNFSILYGTMTAAPTEQYFLIWDELIKFHFGATLSFGDNVQPGHYVLWPIRKNFKIGECQFSAGINGWSSNSNFSMQLTDGLTIEEVSSFKDLNFTLAYVTTRYTEDFEQQIFDLNVYVRIMFYAKPITQYLLTFMYFVAASMSSLTIIRIPNIKEIWHLFLLLLDNHMGTAYSNYSMNTKEIDYNLTSSLPMTYGQHRFSIGLNTFKNDVTTILPQIDHWYIITNWQILIIILLLLILFLNFLIKWFSIYLKAKTEKLLFYQCHDSIINIIYPTISMVDTLENFLLTNKYDWNMTVIQYVVDGNIAFKIATIPFCVISEALTNVIGARSLTTLHDRSKNVSGKLVVSTFQSTNLHDIPAIYWFIANWHLKQGVTFKNEQYFTLIMGTCGGDKQFKLKLGAYISNKPQVACGNDRISAYIYENCGHKYLKYPKCCVDDCYNALGGRQCALTLIPNQDYMNDMKKFNSDFIPMALPIKNIVTISTENYLIHLDQIRRRRMEKILENSDNMYIPRSYLIIRTFPKMEPHFAKDATQPDESIDFDKNTRAICGRTDEFLLQLGPWTHTDSKIISAVWNGGDVEDCAYCDITRTNLSNNIIYAGGKSAEAIGALIYEKTKNWGNVVVDNGDYRQYDSSITQEHHLIERQYMDWMFGFQEDLHLLLDEQMTQEGVMRGKTKDTVLLWSVNGPRGSGNPNTSVGNSKINVTQQAFTINKQINIYTALNNNNMIILINGDDTCNFYDTTAPIFNGLALNKAHYVDTMKHLGMDMKLSRTTMTNANFCQGFFVPCRNKYEQDTYVLTPKIGRCIEKCFVSTKRFTKRQSESWVKEVSRCYMNTYHHIKFMHNYFSYYYSKHEKADNIKINDFEFKFMSKHKFNETSATKQWLYNHYGINDEDLMVLERMFERPEQINWDHPLLETIRQVDLFEKGIDLSDQINEIKIDLPIVHKNPIKTYTYDKVGLQLKGSIFDNSKTNMIFNQQPVKPGIITNEQNHNRYMQSISKNKDRAISNLYKDISQPTNSKKEGYFSDIPRTNKDKLINKRKLSKNKIRYPPQERKSDTTDDDDDDDNDNYCNVCLTTHHPKFKCNMINCDKCNQVHSKNWLSCTKKQGKKHYKQKQDYDSDEEHHKNIRKNILKHMKRSKDDITCFHCQQLFIGDDNERCKCDYCDTCHQIRQSCTCKLQQKKSMKPPIKSNKNIIKPDIKLSVDNIPNPYNLTSIEVLDGKHTNDPPNNNILLKQDVQLASPILSSNIGKQIKDDTKLLLNAPINYGAMDNL